jgi:hypothetical protein
VGSRLTGKRLGWRLTERVNDGGAAAEIRARETALRGRDGRTAMGFAVGCSEWGRRREKRAEVRQHRPTPFWEGAGEAGADGGRETGPTRGGSGARAGGLPADRRTAPGRQRRETGGRGRRAPCVHCRPNRGGGERLTGGPWQ